MSSNTPSSSSLFTAHGDPPPGPTFSLSPLAILSVLLGFFSLVALLGQAWWFCAGIGLLGCTLILVRLSRQQAKGASMLLAVSGLAISLIAVSFAPTYFYLRQIQLCRQASSIGEQWLHSIVTGNSYLALAAMGNPETRLVNEQLKDFYNNTPNKNKAYKRFINQKLIRSLIELKGKARIRLYSTESILNLDGAVIVTNLYAITDGKNSELRKPLFVRLVIERKTKPNSNQGYWQILRYRGGVRPRS